ncbi:MAG: hypothetical protein HY934_10790 [Candidatus Firestonebacteria bacterium]|nr:hypothetical protein [Candidatus Firestonebacteria bacterium]
MAPGCPYFKKVECGIVPCPEAYCSGYASGKLRIPVLHEEISYCNHEENFRDCYTYQFAVKSKIETIVKSAI